MKKDNQLPSEIIDTAQVEEEENQRSTHQYMETLENIQTTLENPDTTPLPQQDHPKVVSLMNDDSLLLWNRQALNYDAKWAAISAFKLTSKFATKSALNYPSKWAPNSAVESAANDVFLGSFSWKF